MSLLHSPSGPPDEELLLDDELLLDELLELEVLELLELEELELLDELEFEELELLLELDELELELLPPSQTSPLTGGTGAGVSGVPLSPCTPNSTNCPG